MSNPYFRGTHNNNHTNSNNMYRGGNNDRRVADEASVTLMELENNQRWAELGEQVDLLRELSQDINQEVKSQNKLIDKMGMSFGTTTDMFKSTIGRLGIMLTSGNSNHMLYLIVFVVFVFLLLYYLMSWK